MGKGTLDLPSVRCTELSIQGNSTIASNVKDEVEALIRQTEHEELDDGKGVAGHYQSKSKVGGRDQGEVAVLTCTDTPEGSLLVANIFVFVPDGELPPPRECFLPLTDLLHFTGNSEVEINAMCAFSFSYELSEDLQSRIQLPSPLMLADFNRPKGVTHIEAVMLSRRVGDKWGHTIEVEVAPVTGPSSMLSHEVRFTFQGVLSVDSLEQWLSDASELSRTLIVER